MNTKNLIQELKAQGYKVTRSSARVNGQPAFRVDGKVGLFSKLGLMALVGYF